MSFNVKSEIKDNVAMLTLSGSLDSSSASEFQTEIQKVATQNPREMVLFVKDLSFMASAGLRTIVFAKQKLGTAVHIYLVQPQDLIIDTLKMTGFIHSVYVVDKYPV